MLAEMTPPRVISGIFHLKNQIRSNLREREREREKKHVNSGHYVLPAAHTLHSDQNKKELSKRIIIILRIYNKYVSNKSNWNTF